MISSISTAVNFRSYMIATKQVIYSNAPSYCNCSVENCNKISRVNNARGETITGRDSQTSSSCKPYLAQASYKHILRFEK